MTNDFIRYYIGNSSLHTMRKVQQDSRLIEPLAEYYSQHSDTDSFTAWAEKVKDVTPKLEALVNEVHTKKVEGASQMDHHILNLVRRKMRVKEFEIRLSSSVGHGDS